MTDRASVDRLVGRDIMADGRLSVKGPGGGDVDRQFRQSRRRVSRQTPHRHGPCLSMRLGRMALNAARRLSSPWTSQCCARSASPAGGRRAAEASETACDLLEQAIVLLGGAN